MASITVPRPSPARQRLLETASRIFYTEGIHGVGVDRVIGEAEVTRATFYRHFPSKEALVLAYLQREDEGIRGIFESAAETIDDPEAMLDAIILGIADDVEHHHTRGCPFINASAEYPDPTSDVRLTVAQHRAWFAGVLESVLVAAGRDDALERARALVLLRDAALVGGYLDGPDTMRDTFVRTARAAAAV